MHLLVTIDTEEEFDWQQPFSSQHQSVHAIQQLPRLQRLFDALDVWPTYVVDYPVATTPSSVRVLRALLEQGRCEVGAHLHPWVNPPLEEVISAPHSYLCNLPLALQQQKLVQLTEAIEQNLQVQPKTFKAGRYGLDFRLVPTLQELGYCVDTSVLAYTDMRADAGPDFSRHGSQPFLLGEDGQRSNAPHSASLLEVPCTAGFTRRPFAWSARVYRFAALSRLRLLRMRGVLWRTGMLRRVVLSPEGFETRDLLRLVECSYREGAQTLNVTLHSPSMEPGNTPYVRTAEELEVLLERLRRTLQHALDLGAQPVTMYQLSQVWTSAGVQERRASR